MKQKCYPSFCLCFILFFQLPLCSQVFKLVKDINNGSKISAPNNLTDVNGALFFTINDGVNTAPPQLGVWRTNGTSTGTVKIYTHSAASNLVNVDGTLYFLVSSPGTITLMKSDGTAAGTSIVSSSFGPGTGNLTNLNGVLYFVGYNGAGPRLWKSDGTAAGTVQVVTMGITNMINVNNTLFFSDNTSLWKSDGTAAGTVEVKNGFTAGQFHDFYNADGTLYFVANDGVNGQELWKSDGTNAGTLLVKDITTGAAGSTMHHLSSLAGEIYFAVDDAANGVTLWKSDGSEAGTVLVKDIYAGPNPATKISSLTTLGSTVYFSAYDGTDKWEAWKSDGTANGTTLIKEFSLGNTPLSSLTGFTGANGILYFSANDGFGHQELWKSDGTTSGTMLVNNFFTPTTGSNPANFINFNGTLFCSATSPERLTFGNEVWKSNGSWPATACLKDISPMNLSSSPRNFAVFNNELYFSATDGGGAGAANGIELYKSDGTTAGTVMLKNINTNLAVPDRSSHPANFMVANQLLFFSATDLTVNGYELWKTDGTTAGTVLVKNINPGVNNSNPASLTNVNDILYFTADNGTDGRELWKSDGTDAGTIMVKNINPGGSSNPDYLTVVNGTLYFVADDGINGRELWASDGTETGTTLIKDINTAGNSNATLLTNMNGVLYFSANDGAGNEVWKSDGTIAGTVLVKDINTGVNSSDPASFTYLNGAVLFSADNGTTGRELWKTDGTEAGTVLVKDINTGGGSNPAVFTKAGNNLLFVANNGVLGNEIWITNGTAGGTSLLQDVETGATGSDPTEMIVINGKVYAGLTTSSFGSEIWIADVPADISLPLTLLEFKGSVVNNDGVLQWKTDNEMNTASFVIERSTDGRNYKSVGSVGSANTPGIHYYDFTDADITSLGISDFYYRLKQTDIDGKYTYSNIVVLSVTAGKNFVLLYPNPVKNKINMTINVSQKEKMQWQLTDNMGRRVKAGSYDLSPGSMAISIDIAGLSSGMYLIQLNSSSLQKVIKVIKQ